MDGWTKRRFHPLEEGRRGEITRFAVETYQDDIEPVLDQNKRWQNEPHKTHETLGHHIATIPNAIIAKWMNEDGFDFMRASGVELQKYLRKKLSDPDYAYLRAR